MSTNLNTMPPPQLLPIQIGMSSNVSPIRSKIRILTVNDIYTTTASLLSTTDILEDVSKSINLDLGTESKPHEQPDTIPAMLPIGGLDILRNVYDKLSDHPENTICLLNGDILGGSQIAEHFRGESMVEILNTISPSTICIGNHEFDYGTEQLEKCISQTNFPWLGENITVDRPADAVPRVLQDVVRICRQNKLQTTGDAPPTTLSHVNNTPPCLIYDFCIDASGTVVKKYRNALLEVLFALMVRNEINTNDYAAILRHQEKRDQDLQRQSPEDDTNTSTGITTSLQQSSSHTGATEPLYIYRVGVFSVCTSQTPSLAYPSKNTTFSRADTLSIVYALLLKLIGCHSCILSSHLSIRVDMDIARLCKIFSERLFESYKANTPKDVLKRYNNTWLNSHWSLIDCIYGGHEHTCYVLQCDEYNMKQTQKKKSSGLHQTTPSAAAPAQQTPPTAITTPTAATSSSTKPSILEKQLNKALDSDDDMGGDLNPAKYHPGHSNSNPADTNPPNAHPVASDQLPSLLSSDPVSASTGPESDDSSSTTIIGSTDDSDSTTVEVHVTGGDDSEPTTPVQPSPVPSQPADSYLIPPTLEAMASMQAPSSTQIYRKNIVYNAHNGPAVIKVGMNAQYTGVIDLDIEFSPEVTTISSWDPLKTIVSSSSLQSDPEHPENSTDSTPCKDTQQQHLLNAYYHKSFEVVSQLLLTASIPPPKNAEITDDLLTKFDRILQVFTETPVHSFLKTQLINTIHKRFHPDHAHPSHEVDTAHDDQHLIDYNPSLDHKVFSHPLSFLSQMQNELQRELAQPTASKNSPVHTIIKDYNGVVFDRHPHQFDLVINPSLYIQSIQGTPRHGKPSSSPRRYHAHIPRVVHSRMRFHMVPNISTASNQERIPPLSTSPPEHQVVYHMPSNLADTYFHPFKPTSDVITKWRTQLDLELGNGRDLQQAVFKLITSMDTRSMNSRAKSGVTGPNLVADAMYWSGYPLYEHLCNLHRKIHGDTSIIIPEDAPEQGRDVLQVLGAIPQIDGFFSCINGGFLRGDKHYAAGTTITIADILNELPFPKHQSFILIRGDDLIRGMNQQLSYVPQPSGAFPHFSDNVSIEYSVTPLKCRPTDSICIDQPYTALPYSENAPANPYCARMETDPTNPFFTRNQDNSVIVSHTPFKHPPEPPIPPRVINVSIDGKAVRSKGFYLIATTQFIAWGGDGLKSYARACLCTHINPITQTQIIREVVISYCEHLRQQQHRCGPEVLELETSKRTTIVPKP